MQDRISKNPGRVLITPENGNSSFYATVTMADNPTQEGTPPTKANLLTDSVASKLRLDANATVDKALDKLYQRGEWEILADVTVAESVYSANVTLSKALNDYHEFFVLIGRPSKDSSSKSINANIQIPFSNNDSNIFSSLTVEYNQTGQIAYQRSETLNILKIESNKILIAPFSRTMNSLAGTIATDQNLNRIVISCNSSYAPMSTGTNILVIAR